MRKPTAAKRGRGRPSKYAWERWFRTEGPFLVRKGKDYTCNTPTFMQMIRSRATKVGARASLHLVDDQTIQVTITRQL